MKQSNGYKQLNLKVDNQLFDLVTEYAEQERRSVNGAVAYIIQEFFKGRVDER